MIEPFRRAQSDVLSAEGASESGVIAPAPGDRDCLIGDPSGLLAVRAVGTGDRQAREQLGAQTEFRLGQRVERVGERRREPLVEVKDRDTEPGAPKRRVGEQLRVAAELGDLRCLPERQPGLMHPAGVCLGVPKADQQLAPPEVILVGIASSLERLLIMRDRQLEGDRRGTALLLADLWRLGRPQLVREGAGRCSGGEAQLALQSLGQPPVCLDCRAAFAGRGQPAHQIARRGLCERIDRDHPPGQRDRGGQVTSGLALGRQPGEGIDQRRRVLIARLKHPVVVEFGKELPAAQCHGFVQFAPVAKLLERERVDPHRVRRDPGIVPVPDQTRGRRTERRADL